MISLPLLHSLDVTEYGLYPVTTRIRLGSTSALSQD